MSKAKRLTAEHRQYYVLRNLCFAPICFFYGASVARSACAITEQHKCTTCITEEVHLS